RRSRARAPSGRGRSGPRSTRTRRASTSSKGSRSQVRHHRVEGQGALAGAAGALPREAHPEGEDDAVGRVVEAVDRAVAVQVAGQAQVRVGDVLADLVVDGGEQDLPDEPLAG